MHSYISCLNKQFSENQVVPFSTNGTRTKGWLLPKDDVLARDEVLRVVGDSIDDIFRQAWALPVKRSGARNISSEFGR